MPRFVDPEQRKNDILDATVEAIAEGGFPHLTVRSLAKRLGGSSTLVTHYFANREELLSALADRVLKDAAEKSAELLEISDPDDRLRAVLEWFLPNTPESLKIERVRIVLVAHKATEPVVADMSARMEPGMRGLMRQALAEFVDPEDLEGMVDLLRAWTSGVVLSAVEHPEIWTPERQMQALDRFVSSLSLPLAARPSAAPSAAR